MKKYKIIIYSNKKIVIQLLYTYIKEYIERKKKDDYTFSVIIEGRNSIQTVEAEAFFENSILVFDCCSKEEMDNLKNIFNKRKKNCEGINGNKESVYIIVLDSIYCKIEDNLFLNKKDGVYFIYDLQELTQIIEVLIDGDDNQTKTSDNLTRREREILVLITKGKLNKEIANELNITERTVKNHIANLFKKINVYDRTQAAVYAIKNGIYSLYLEDL